MYFTPKFVKLEVKYWLLIIYIVGTMEITPYFCGTKGGVYHRKSPDFQLIFGRIGVFIALFMIP